MTEFICAMNEFIDAIKDAFREIGRGAWSVLYRVPPVLVIGVLCMIMVCLLILMWQLHWILGLFGCVAVSLVLAQPQK